MATSNGFWQCALDRALLLFCLVVVGLEVCERTGVLCLDWGQTFTAAGVIAFLYVLVKGVLKMLMPDAQPALFSANKDK